VVRDLVTTGLIAGRALRVPANGDGAITVIGGRSVGAGAAVWACTLAGNAAAPIAVKTTAAWRA